jgi:hypothetical protein
MAFHILGEPTVCTKILPLSMNLINFSTGAFTKAVPTLFWYGWLSEGSSEEKGQQATSNKQQATSRQATKTKGRKENGRK